MTRAPKRWSLAFYESPSGRRPVEEFLDGLNRKQQAKVATYLDLLADSGLHLGPPALKKVEGDVWELRVPVERGQVRVFFCRVKDEFVLLHAIRKKQEKLPARELQTALRRCRQHRERGA